MNPDHNINSHNRYFGSPSPLFGKTTQFGLPACVGRRYRERCGILSFYCGDLACCCAFNVSHAGMSFLWFEFLFLSAGMIFGREQTKGVTYRLSVPSFISTFRSLISKPEKKGSVKWHRFHVTIYLFETKNDNWHGKITVIAPQYNHHWTSESSSIHYSTLVFPPFRPSLSLCCYVTYIFIYF